MLDTPGVERTLVARLARAAVGGWTVALLHREGVGDAVRDGDVGHLHRPDSKRGERGPVGALPDRGDLGHLGGVVEDASGGLGTLQWGIGGAAPACFRHSTRHFFDFYINPPI